VFVFLLAAQAAIALEKSKPLELFGRQTWRTENGLPQNSVHAILQTRDGYIWLGTEGGLVRFDGIRFAVYNSQNTPGLTSNNVLSLYEDGAGVLQVVTAAGSTAYRNGRFEISGRAEKTYPRRITARLQDREGSVWIGTDAGLARLANGTEERFPPGDVLSSDAVLSIYEDREGNLWAGTESQGVTILRDRKFTTYTSRENALDDIVLCVFEDRKGVVWMGTNGHGLRRLENGNFSRVTTSEGLSSNVVFALAEDGNGDLLAGTPDGLNRVRAGGISVVTSADGLADDFVRSIFRDNDGSLWMGTRRGLSHWKENHFTTYTQADGLGSDLVGALLRDKQDDLWIGTFRGLTRLRNGKLKNYTTRDGLSSNVITALHADEQGNLWIGTQDSGLNRLRDGKFTHFSSKQGLPQAIYGIAEDTRHNLWVPSNTGIFRIRWDGSDAVTVVTYGTSDGLRISECSAGGHPATWQGADGALWFATLKGAAVTRLNDQQPNRFPPPVAIESVSIDDQMFDPGQVKQVRPGHSRFSFEYTGLSFVAPQKVQFRYRLEGFDRDWIEAGTRRAAYYTNIAPGNYRFRVLARNNDGLWNKSGASFSFHLEPHFYQTYWFYACVAGALGFLTYLIYRWRVREVEARFHAVLEERNRIAREIHDTLAQGFAGVSVQLEIVAQLFGSSMDSAKEHLDQARVLVRNSLSEARRAIWQLRSQSAENEDFAARLSKMANRMTAAAPVTVRLQVHGTYRPLGQDVEEQLLKIGQEAVINAVRHAEAEHINIELAFDVKKLRMTIADDGRGFPLEANGSGPDGHFGLRGMRERAEQINAELMVKSIVGAGTSITVEAAVSSWS
jgi:ligand-binding sensor domain-containing protein/signal transduction histidine kinase